MKMITIQGKLFASWVVMALLQQQSSYSALMKQLVKDLIKEKFASQCYPLALGMIMLKFLDGVIILVVSYG